MSLLFMDTELKREIARYSAMRARFDGFLNLPAPRDGVMELFCAEKRPASPQDDNVPVYAFDMRVNGERVGTISLRVGFNRALYYTGQIGYSVEPRHRGKGYAVRACRLLESYMRAHDMTKVLITNNPDNIASRRVCEKLGARLLRVVKIPFLHELYRYGDRYKNIFLWDIGGNTDRSYTGGG